MTDLYFIHFLLYFHLILKMNVNGRLFIFQKVSNRTADITRNTVQKSVCVLCTLPIYGYIQVRKLVSMLMFSK